MLKTVELLEIRDKHEDLGIYEKHYENKKKNFLQNLYETNKQCALKNKFDFNMNHTFHDIKV